MRITTELGKATTFDEFQEALGAGTRIVPLTVSLTADLDTPLSLFLKVKRQDEVGFLLESVERGESTGRYSFLGIANRDEILRPPLDTDPLEWLKEKLPLDESQGSTSIPTFWGGAVGHLGWEAVRALEKAIGPRPEKFGKPDDCQHAFLLCHRCLIFDHVAQTIIAVAVVEVPDDTNDADVRQLYNEGIVTLRELRDRATGVVQLPRLKKPSDFTTDEQFLTSKDEFIEQVEKTKRYIHSGEILQLVLSLRVKRKTWVDSIAIYRALRMLNPSPYTFLLDFGDYQLVGSSPEMLVELSGRRAAVCPIAGTRKRTGDLLVDREAEADMLQDPKEKAEHLMLVDTGRSDLGRVCDYGTIEVPRYSEVEYYSHVMHMVSRVEGQLSSDKDAYDLVRSTFPAGTVSGAPKIRAIQLIDELESVSRDFYAGAVGYFGSWGNLDTCITIRTLMLKDGEVTFQAGAGIVADSEPNTEWEESLNKLAALRLAVDVAETSLGEQQ